LAGPMLHTGAPLEKAVTAETNANPTSKNSIVSIESFYSNELFT
jgi:hypothetical protein